MVGYAKREFLHQEITSSVISAFYEAYNTLGFGFLEHIYGLALEYELRLRDTRWGARCPSSSSTRVSSSADNAPASS